MTVIHSGRHVVIPSLLQVRTFAPKTAAAIVWPPVDDWWSVSGKTCVAEVDWETAQRWGMRGPAFGGGRLSAQVGVNSTRRVVVDFRGQAGGGVPMNEAQFSRLKRELISAIQLGG